MFLVATVASGLTYGMYLLLLGDLHGLVAWGMAAASVAVLTGMEW